MSPARCSIPPHSGAALPPISQQINTVLASPAKKAIRAASSSALARRKRSSVI
jgi:hypothetical protein